MQATVIRETGWTVQQYLQQPMSDVFDLIADLNEHPPAYRILAWRYLKPQPTRARSGNRPAPAKLGDSDVRELAQSLGCVPQPIPDDVRARAKWAFEQARKLKKN